MWEAIKGSTDRVVNALLSIRRQINVRRAVSAAVLAPPLPPAGSVAAAPGPGAPAAAAGAAGLAASRGGSMGSGASPLPRSRVAITAAAATAGGGAARALPGRAVRTGPGGAGWGYPRTGRGLGAAAAAAAGGGWAVAGRGGRGGAGGRGQGQRAGGGGAGGAGQGQGQAQGQGQGWYSKGRHVTWDQQRQAYQQAQQPWGQPPPQQQQQSGPQPMTAVASPRAYAGAPMAAGGLGAGDAAMRRQPSQPDTESMAHWYDRAYSDVHPQPSISSSVQEPTTFSASGVTGLLSPNPSGSGPPPPLSPSGQQQPQTLGDMPAAAAVAAGGAKGRPAVGGWKAALLSQPPAATDAAPATRVLPRAGVDAVRQQSGAVGPQHEQQQQQQQLQPRLSRQDSGGQHSTGSGGSGQPRADLGPGRGAAAGGRGGRGSAAAARGVRGGSNAAGRGHARMYGRGGSRGQRGGVDAVPEEQDEGVGGRAASALTDKSAWPTLPPGKPTTAVAVTAAVSSAPGSPGPASVDGRMSAGGGTDGGESVGASATGGGGGGAGAKSWAAVARSSGGGAPASPKKGGLSTAFLTAGAVAAAAAAAAAAAPPASPFAMLAQQPAASQTPSTSSAQPSPHVSAPPSPGLHAQQQQQRQAPASGAASPSAKAAGGRDGAIPTPPARRDANASPRDGDASGGSLSGGSLPGGGSFHFTPGRSTARPTGQAVPGHLTPRIGSPVLPNGHLATRAWGKPAVPDSTVAAAATAGGGETGLAAPAMPFGSPSILADFPPVATDAKAPPPTAAGTPVAAGTGATVATPTSPVLTAPASPAHQPLNRVNSLALATQVSLGQPLPHTTAPHHHPSPLSPAAPSSPPIPAPTPTPTPTPTPAHPPATLTRGPSDHFPAAGSSIGHGFGAHGPTGHLGQWLADDPEVMALLRAIVNDPFWGIRWSDLSRNLNALMGTGSTGQVFAGLYHHAEVAIKVIAINRGDEFDLQVRPRAKCSDCVCLHRMHGMGCVGWNGMGCVACTCSAGVVGMMLLRPSPGRRNSSNPCLSPAAHAGPDARAATRGPSLCSPFAPTNRPC